MFYRSNRRRSDQGVRVPGLAAAVRVGNRAKICLSGFKRGDADAFSRIYGRFKRPILRLVRTRIADEEVAEELTQEIFLKAYRFRESYEEEYAFSTWLWTIARNTLSDYLRGVKGLVSHAQDVEPEDVPCPGKCAESTVIEKDERRHLIARMRSLTRLQKRVVWMRAIHELSYAEISSKLGLSLAAVKNLAYRAKLTLSASASAGPATA